MTIRRIRTIFRKDLRDAIRDARVLVALLVPLGLGIFYNFTFDEDTTTPSADVIYYAADETQLPATLMTIVGDTVNVRFHRAQTPEEVHNEVANDDADLGLIVPAGFDEAVARNEQPDLQVLQPATTGFAADYVTAAIEPALRLMAGQSPPAKLDVAAVAEPSESETAIDKVGLRTWSVLAAVAMMIGMIAMLAIPVVLAEENEKKTLDALVMIASYGEVVAAKAALGVFYIVVMVPLLFAITRQHVERTPLFVAAVAFLGVALIGFGLLLAGFFKSANQLNTWSGIFLLPVIAPAFIVGLPTPDLLEKVAVATPTGAAMKLFMNSATDERVFGGNLVSFVVIAAWAVVAYALLMWQLSRRQA